MFKSFILKSGTPLKTLTLEKAAINGDGDMAIIAASFAQSPGAFPKELDDKWKPAQVWLNYIQKSAY